MLTAGCFATTDATIKHLGLALQVLVLMWSRYLLQTTVMAALQITRRDWRFALFQVVTNRLSSLDDMVTTNLLSGVGALAILCTALVLLPVDVVLVLSGASSMQWMLIRLVGAIATLAMG